MCIRTRQVYGSLVGAVLRLKSDTPSARSAVEAAFHDTALFSKETRPRKVVFVADIPKNAMGKVRIASVLCSPARCARVCVCALLVCL